MTTTKLLTDALARIDASAYDLDETTAQAAANDLAAAAQKSKATIAKLSQKRFEAIVDAAIADTNDDADRWWGGVPVDAELQAAMDNVELTEQDIADAALQSMRLAPEAFKSLKTTVETQAPVVVAHKGSSHMGHAHENTKAARAMCRRHQAKGLLIEMIAEGDFDDE